MTKLAYLGIFAVVCFGICAATGVLPPSSELHKGYLSPFASSQVTSDPWQSMLGVVDHGGEDF